MGSRKNLFFSVSAIIFLRPASSFPFHKILPRLFHNCLKACAFFLNLPCHDRSLFSQSSGSSSHPAAHLSEFCRPLLSSSRGSSFRSSSFLAPEPALSSDGFCFLARSGLICRTSVSRRAGASQHFPAVRLVDPSLCFLHFRNTLHFLSSASVVLFPIKPRAADAATNRRPGGALPLPAFPQKIPACSFKNARYPAS